MRGLQPVASAPRPGLTRAKAWVGLFQPAAGKEPTGCRGLPKCAVKCPSNPGGGAICGQSHP
eukprot:1277735-Pyramimonas_sp.AAC.1